MAHLAVVLVDEDEQYLVPLEMKFVEEYGEEVEVIVITDREYMAEYFSTPRKINILIINEALYSSELRKHDIQNVFLLTETNRENQTGDISLVSIYKYTSVKEIFNEIINDTEISDIGGINDKRKSKLIFTYSPSGGSGNTTFSIGICACLAKNHKKVVYINTESLQEFDYFFTNKDSVSNNFERQLLSKNEYIYDIFESSVRSEMFDYLPPLPRSLTASNIKLDNYIFLLNAIKEKNNYDFIVVDSSSEFSEEKSKIMSISDNVIILTEQDRFAEHKLNKFLLNIDCSDNQKFIFICNKYIRDKENALVSTDTMKNYRISEYVEYDSEINNKALKDFSDNVDFQRIAYMFV